MNSRDPFGLRRKPALSIFRDGSLSPTKRTFTSSDSASQGTSPAAVQPGLTELPPEDGMSFSLPRNMPSFDSPQRGMEDGKWGGSGTVHRSGVGNGVGAKIGTFLDHRELPMYKDKPYSYAASGRKRPLWRRKRTALGGVLFFLSVLYLLGVFSDPSKARVPTSKGAGHAWSWLKNQGAGEVVDWDERREKVKEAFILSWDAYEKHAWGFDEFHPVSGSGRQMVDKGMGWIIVDALDTLMIMNLTSRLAHAREWVATSLDYDKDHDVNTFETTIRMLGGLLSAHYLSTTYPDMAPLGDAEGAQGGDDLYIEKATDLADRLLGAFDSNSGIPYASVNLKTMRGIQSHADEGASSTAEAATLQLELKYMAKLTGEDQYWDKAENVIKVIDDNGAPDGLVPIFIYATTGSFRGANIRLGSRGDSYYEYLIKQYLQTSRQEPIYLDMWNQALSGMRKHLLAYSKTARLLVLGERPAGLDEPLSPKMDHLVCFLPGTIALAATGGLPLAEARLLPSWTPQHDSDMQLARDLTQTCMAMYKFTPTGLAGEITHFELDSPPALASDPPHNFHPPTTLDDAADADWRADIRVKANDAHNLLRPETAESLFYMYRITGDSLYRDWGWEMFTAFVAHAAVDDDGDEGRGFASIASVLETPTRKRDDMESFWLAETLKYFYLLFSDKELLPLDTCVINTEAHFFPRFELGKLFATGWQRKPRDKDGRVVHGGAPSAKAAAAAQEAPTETETVVAGSPAHKEREGEGAS